MHEPRRRSRSAGGLPAVAQADLPPRGQLSLPWGRASPGPSSSRPWLAAAWEAAEEPVLPWLAEGGVAASQVEWAARAQAERAWRDARSRRGDDTDDSEYTHFDDDPPLEAGRPSRSLPLLSAAAPLVGLEPSLSPASAPGGGPVQARRAHGEEDL